MVLPNFEYLTPATLGEACNLLAELGDGAKVMAGATDLIPPMKDKAISPEYIIDLRNIPDLDYLDYDDKQGLKIGAMTTLRTIEFSKEVKKNNPAVAYASKVVASPQIRAKGTLVGNICNASPSCDNGPNMIAQEATILVQGPNSDRVIKAEDFFTGVKKTSLEPGEIVTGVIIPALAKNQKASYIKHAVRKAMDLAIIGVAVKLTMDGNKCTDAKIALGAVATTPIRAPQAEEILIGKELTDEIIVKASEAAMNICEPISDIRASKEYRKDMIRVFTKRAIKQALES